MTAENNQKALVNIYIDATAFASSGSYFGGIVGQNCGQLSNAYVTGTIKAPNVNNVGGAIGYAKFDKPADNSYVRNSSTNEIMFLNSLSKAALSASSNLSLLKYSK